MKSSTSLNMKFSSVGLELLHDFEEFQKHLYDTDGGGHCTVGWGHLVHKGKCDGRENEKVFLKGITKQTGNSLLEKDTKLAENAVNKKVAALGATLTQNQFDALVSFAYNVGTGNLAAVLTACVGNNGKLDLSKIPDRMKCYNTSSGKILLGLVKRREREVELFNK